MGIFIPATVVVLLLAWVGASNHCGLAVLQALQQEKTSEHLCCHQSDAAPVPGGRVSACCDSLKVSLPATASAPVGEWSVVPPIWPGGGTDLVVPDQTALRIPSTDASPPPGAESFSELVLSRSLCAHAPPLS